jgi:hypothetical protein
VTSTEVKNRLERDPDFVYLKRFDYSLKKVMLRYPDGCPTRVIAQALLLTEEDVEIMHQRIISRLQDLMGV